MPKPLIVSGEFATVELTLDTAGRGPRLCIRDLRSNQVRLFSPLELESLVWMTNDVARVLVDPSQRWNDSEGRLVTDASAEHDWDE